MKRLCDMGVGYKYYSEPPMRQIDEDNDIYPSPIMLHTPSEKVYGFNRLFYAIMYFRYNRVRGLIVRCQKELMDFTVFDVVEPFRTNLVELISSSNHPTNIDYNNNIKLYETMFFIVLDEITSENLAILFANTATHKVAWGKPLAFEVFKALRDRPHMLLALWNYGMTTSERDIEHIGENIGLKRLFTGYSAQDFIPAERYKLLDNICPITLEPITVPALLTDGTAYEYAAIDEYLRTRDTDPKTNARLSRISGSLVTRNSDGKWVHDVEVTAKILYLPLDSCFIHYELINTL